MYDLLWIPLIGYCHSVPTDSWAPLGDVLAKLLDVVWEEDRAALLENQDLLDGFCAVLESDVGSNNRFGKDLMRRIGEPLYPVDPLDTNGES